MYCDWLEAHCLARLGHFEMARGLLEDITEVVDTSGVRRNPSEVNDLKAELSPTPRSPPLHHGRLTGRDESTDMAKRTSRSRSHARTGARTDTRPDSRPGNQPARPFLAASLIVRDEAANIGACLAALAGVVDEIHVHDTGSTDDTPDLARLAGRTVTRGPWTGDFAAARNEALKGWTAGVGPHGRRRRDRRGPPAALRRFLTRTTVDVIDVAIDNVTEDGVHRHGAGRIHRPDAGIGRDGCTSTSSIRAPPARRRSDPRRYASTTPATRPKPSAGPRACATPRSPGSPSPIWPATATGPIPTSWPRRCSTWGGACTAHRASRSHRLRKRRGVGRARQRTAPAQTNPSGTRIRATLAASSLFLFRSSFFVSQARVAAASRRDPSLRAARCRAGTSPGCGTGADSGRRTRDSATR